MKVLIAIIIVVAVGFVGWKVYEQWDAANRAQEQSRPAQVDSRSLTGLDSRLESSLEEARRGGSRSLKAWLDQYKQTPLLQDPRLASIELDYAILLSSENPREARKIFAQVKERVPPDSPLYPRIQQLEKTFE